MTQEPSQSEISDADIERQVRRLHQFSVYRRWLFAGICWITLGTFSIWALRDRVALGLEHFTWALVRYSIIYDPIPALSLGFCVGITTAILVWQSYNILFGFSPEYRRHLEKQVRRIRNLGNRHPLWKRICQ
ncbi:hypothetical protein IQ249_13815 [Lusitaniella coriacea LEGE 07157]|uniref:Uncharacterized protein n=1 Tax=Lusitaniella coriacea LEGE 07157 TaxID=945747 RepID=A0A8J7DXH6_9CYAN|nr:hypothetical protein [Lusitaniella coriacea]MBE9116978.1 hypothetical protein [Lusitaniella coriacea LEGE 07157]